ncbi:MAG TPA: VOC family protein, partial [Methanomicrobiales archaeon]|nr:VOC family protein [Methanomicrobiales archaeon]
SGGLYAVEGVIGVSRVVYFEIAAEIPERAVKFYREAFGWTIEEEKGPLQGWQITTGPEEEQGIDGTIRWSVGGEPFHTIVTIEVPSVDETLKKITVAGGKMLQPKVALPGLGYHTYCMDTEGNVFRILERDPSAS